MPFPVQVAVGTFADAANGTSHVVPLPTPVGGIRANDLLIYFSGIDGNPALSYDLAFTPIDDQTQGGVINIGSAWMRAAGGETGNLTVTTSTSEGGGHRILCIRGAHPTQAPATATPVGATAAANPNPPSLNPAGWDVEETLWIAYACNDANVAITAAPTTPSQFGDFGNTRWAAAAGAGVATATLASKVASVDPGVFTMTAEDNLAGTMAIRPTPDTTHPDRYFYKTAVDRGANW